MANSTSTMAEGSVNAVQAAAAPHGPARIRPKANLTAGRPRQELAERYDVRIRLVIQPLAPLDDFCSEITKVSDRTTERREPEPGKRAKHLKKRTAPLFPGSVIGNVVLLQGVSSSHTA